MKASDLDNFFMEKALSLAEESRFIAPPNPWVGCVIAEGSSILATGSTQQPGHEHAEMIALRNARNYPLEQATLYVTLEPCCHQGKTGPCTNAIIRSGIRTVVIGIQDPDIQVHGRGIQMLKDAGITVRTSVLKEKIQKQLQPYLFHRTYHTPYTIIKIAQTVDGNIAASDGSSQWITGKKARQDVHSLRNQCQAILVGTNTAILDNPALTVRHTPLQGPPPLRVVIDLNQTIPFEHTLFQTARHTPTLCIVSNTSYASKLAQCNVETLIWKNSGSIPCSWIQQELANRGVLQLLIEGGGRTISHFMQEDAWNELIVYIGPKLLGASTKRPCQWVCSSINEATELSLLDSQRFDNTIKLRYLSAKKTMPQKSSFRYFQANVED